MGAGKKKWKKISICSLLCPLFLLEYSPVWLAISDICSACPPTYLETTYSTFHTHNKSSCPRSFCLASLSLIPILLPFSVHKISVHKCESKLRILIVIVPNTFLVSHSVFSIMLIALFLSSSLIPLNDTVT